MARKRFRLRDYKLLSLGVALWLATPLSAAHAEDAPPHREEAGEVRRRNHLQRNGRLAHGRRHGTRRRFNPRRRTAPHVDPRGRTARHGRLREVLRRGGRSHASRHGERRAHRDHPGRGEREIRLGRHRRRRQHHHEEGSKVSFREIQRRRPLDGDGFHLPLPQHFPPR